VTDVDSMYARMAVISRNLEWLGVQHRADYQPMLDRIAADRPDRPLRTLADAVEATGLGTGRGRGVQPRYTQQTPLNRLVDAARPESELVRAMEFAAKRMNPEDAAFLREQFTAWAANDARFQSLIAGDGLLAELAPLSKDLSALGAAGLKILDAVAANQPLPADWVTQQKAEITRMERPVVEVRMAAARPVKVLLDAATAPKTK